MKGVSSGSGGLANRVTSVNEGRKRVSFGFRVFSGSFGVRSKVLCKCSGNVLIGYKIFRTNSKCAGKFFLCSFKLFGILFIDSKCIVTK